MKTIRIRVPKAAEMLIRKLNTAGFEAYAVGGCVRDSMLGSQPHDWDICTSAAPENVMELFRNQPSTHIIETGLKHGTVTAVVDHVPYEITTYRVEGGYTDHRHPDEVRFVQSLCEDLSRRDFTINAMAYHPDEGLQDFFGGREDLEKGLIRCVGQAEKRFEEDSLRILRALRFSSRFGFQIEEETERAIRHLYGTLSYVSVERIWQETQKMLCGKGIRDILMQYPEVICYVFPELKPSLGFEQQNPYHHFTVYEHLVRSTAEVPPETVLRLTMLFHDSGKPAAFFMDERGIGHAYGHAEISVRLVGEAMERLKVDTKTRERVLLLVKDHDLPRETNRRQMVRRLGTYGEEAYFQLLEVQRADALGKGTFDREEVEREHAKRVALLREIIEEQPCVSLRDLAVNGADLIALGVAPGKRIGNLLNRLLEDVLSEKLPNEREALMEQAGQWIGEEE